MFEKLHIYMYILIILHSKRSSINIFRQGAHVLAEDLRACDLTDHIWIEQLSQSDALPDDQTWVILAALDINKMYRNG